MKEIYIISPGKTGSSTIYHNLVGTIGITSKLTNNPKKNPVYKSINTHSLKILKDTLKYKSDIIIFTGIRNPIDWALSFFFQTYQRKDLIDFRTQKNNYEGEYEYQDELQNSKDYKVFIKIFL